MTIVIVDFNVERFRAYADKQGDRKIDHSSVGLYAGGAWCGCAIGEFLRDELSDVPEDVAELHAGHYDAFASHAESLLPGAVFFNLNNSAPETFAEILDLDWDDEPYNSDYDYDEDE